MVNTLAEVGALATHIVRILTAGSPPVECVQLGLVPSIAYKTSQNWAIEIRRLHQILVVRTDGKRGQYVARLEREEEGGSLEVQCDRMQNALKFEANLTSPAARFANYGLLLGGVKALLQVLYPTITANPNLEELVYQTVYNGVQSTHDKELARVTALKEAQVPPETAEPPVSADKPAQPPKLSNLSTSVFSTVEEVAMFTQYMEERLGALNSAKLRIFSLCDSPQKWQIIASLPDNVGAIEVSALSGARIQARYTVGGTVLTVNYGPERREYEYYVTTSSSDLLDASAFATFAAVVDVVAHAVSAVLPGKKFPYIAEKSSLISGLRGKYVDQWRKLVETATHRAYT